ncbi:hypothetical protein BC629DRAFT_469342 [Irpex lacteus]|nr:hypothetical protein BC629DRAFT_469342 [Irpex lacteus]
MHFFKSLAAFTSLAFGASFVIAVPLSNVGSVPVPPLPNVANSVPAVPSVPDVPHLPRAGVNSLPQILSNVTAELTPLIAELKSITAANATTEVVGPILDSVKSILSPAINDINALVGQPAKTILAAGDGSGQISVFALSQSLTNVFTLAFTGLDSVHSAATTAQDADLTGLIGDLVSTVTDLLSAVLTLVGDLLEGILSGLASGLTALVDGLMSVLTDLGVSSTVTSMMSGAGIPL